MNLTAIFKKTFLSSVGVLLGLFVLPITANAWSAPAGSQMLRADTGDATGQVKMTWVESSGLDNYSVQYGTQPGVYSFGANNIGNTNYFVVGSLNPGQRYYFRLLGMRDGGVVSTNGEVSAVARSGKVAAQTQTVSQVVVAPSVAPVVSMSNGYNPQALRGNYNGEVQITWVDNSDTVNYHLVYTDDLSVWKYGAQNIGDTNYYVVKSLTPGKTYYFMLTAVRSDGSTWTSGVFSGAARVGQVRPGTVVSTPVANNSVLINNVSQVRGTATVSWISVMGANNYDIVYGTMPGVYSFGAQNIGNVTSYTIGSLESGKTYYVKLLAKWDNTPVSWSSEMKVVAH